METLRTVMPLLRDHWREHAWRDGIVYFIGCGDPKLRAVKIGWTSRTPQTRLADLQVGNPERLSFLGYLPGTPDREAALHSRFFSHRLNGEWFRPVPELLDEVALSFPEPRVYAGDPSAEFAGPSSACEHCQLLRSPD